MPVVSFQVIDWIENHGEAFLSKHTGVGKSLHRARALQKRHDDFEDVAQVSLTQKASCQILRIFVLRFLFFRSSERSGSTLNDTHPGASPFSEGRVPPPCTVFTVVFIEHQTSASNLP